MFSFISSIVNFSENQKRDEWIQQALQQERERERDHSNVPVFWSFGEGNNSIPARALALGMDEHGSPLFVGRGFRGGSIQVGKVTAEGACSVPYVSKDAIKPTQNTKQRNRVDVRTNWISSKYYVVRLEPSSGSKHMVF
jgi:hypothetical protein